MRLTYDVDADAALVELGDPIAPGGAPLSQMCDFEVREGAVILLFDQDERLVGVEILGASRVLPQRVIDSAS